jgi:putative ABC transport system permease protein
MLFKLALKNMQKSVKDYAIYFFTLVFAVAMFYTFNSLDAQTSMSALNESSMTTIKQVVTIINYLSIFVAIVLGFLIVYANNFLIKRRKKEFGLYLTLGMSKRKVALILVLETIIIGIISLVVGLLIGFGLSQLFSLLTIKMFDADMSKYKFVFSLNALKQTIIDFGVIYLLAIIFDTISITRFKLIDLIMAAHKNEQIKIKNKYLIGITFILAICLIGYGYYLLFQNVMFSSDNTNKIIIMFASGAIGTLLLFYSLSSILLGLFKKIGSFYYKGLNMFVLKQVNNKINTTVISNTIISLMLMFTIAILSTAVSLTNSVNKGINENNLIDYTVLEFANQNIDENGQISTEPYNINKIINTEQFKKLSNEYLKFNIYDNQEITNGSLLKAEDITDLAKKYGADTAELKNGSIPIMRSSDYISFMKLTNQENNIVNIDDTNYLLLANVDFTYDRYNKFYSEGNTLDFANYHLVPASSSVYRTAIENSSVNSNSGILVLSDKIIDNNLINIPSSTNSNGFYSREEYLLGNFINTDDINATNKAFNDMFENAHYGCMYMTKEDMKNDSIGVKVMMTFIGLYLGITFAISSATVLAIGQLSEAQDNKERYKVLKDLGADNKDINNCLLKQIAIAFGFPLIVGVIHSLVGLKEINKLLDMFGHIDISKNILLISLFIIILYGGYFFVTYLNSKRLIKR